ncbi:hypothetical protein ABE237_14470 [Brevibacillus formosus]|uniref:hypothetical protein n=1 Tax=Brevibacillus formosus TaxID=54913 RepID=UPI0018CEDC9E|nr:hypothetical protein [Brevibacillus formosus]MBG9945072.1 hypothetical protein [Brevibacillus formosus]
MIFTVDSHQISIHYEHAEPVQIHWDEVYSVSYYKIDCIEYEMGYLVFDLVFGEFIEINDSDQNWAKIVNDLEKYLPSQTSDWRHSLHSWSIDDGILYLYEKV